MNRMSRYKKYITFLCMFLVVACSVCSFSFDSKAADNVVTVPWNQPSISDNTGYITILYQNSSGSVFADTYQWVLNPTWNSDNFVDEGSPTGLGEVSISVSSTLLSFEAYMPFDLRGSFVLWSYSSSGAINLRKQFYLDGNDSDDYYCTASLGYSKIIGFECNGGNLASLSTSISANNAYTIVYGGDSAIYDLLDTFFVSFGSSFSVVSDRIGWILADIERYLPPMEELLSDVKSQLQSINLKLGDIIDYLVEPDEETSDEMDDFSDSSANQSQNLNELNGQNKQDKIDINGASSDVDSNLDMDSMSEYGVLISVFTSNSHIMQFIMIVLSVGLVSYVLFGKRR